LSGGVAKRWNDETKNSGKLLLTAVFSSLLFGERKRERFVI
jgi:hypothetical protein